MMRFELGVFGSSQFQVTISTSSYCEDEEIKMYPKIFPPSVFDISYNKEYLREQNVHHHIDEVANNTIEKDVGKHSTKCAGNNL